MFCLLVLCRCGVAGVLDVSRAGRGVDGEMRLVDDGVVASRGGLSKAEDRRNGRCRSFERDAVVKMPR